MGTDIRVTPDELIALSDELIALWETGDAMVSLLGRQVAEHLDAHPGGTCPSCAAAAAASFNHYATLGRLATRVNEIAKNVVPDGSLESMTKYAEEASKRGASTSRAIRRRALRRIK